MRSVNLLPKDEGRQRRQPGAVALTAVLGSVLVTAVLAGLFLNTSSSVTSKQSELDSLRAELAAIPPPPPTPTGQSTLELEKSKRIGLLSTALGQRVAWDRVLREVSLVLPEDVWLETLSANAADPTAAPAPGQAAPSGGFSITGYAYSHDGVARLLARLALIRHLEGVKLNSSALDHTNDRNVVKFTIAAQLRQAGGTS
jgi:Tfp pilus assembly protein PilN